MKLITVAVSDIGISRKVNQDSVYSNARMIKNTEVAFSVVCDGMGGLSEGEVASASVVNAFSTWFNTVFPQICEDEIDFEELKLQWSKIVYEQNKYLMDYGVSKNIRLGTTLTALLIVDGKYYGVHVGDSRIYEISDRVYQITNDHTLVARDVRLGNLTPEQARKDPRQNILLQCIGASDAVEPDFLYGNAEKDTVYLLCSDGFRHVISDDEIYSNLNCFQLVSEDEMIKKANYLIDLNKSRMEKDNISAILIRTF
ncbi:MAG: putative protein phosphatase 2C-type [Firmicutes bacterium ADurb.Bin419]|nr:MAG: putative protein phosphatase 2C-type [Firmicutes bacterium ADurb.Bin419]